MGREVRRREAEMGRGREGGRLSSGGGEDGEGEVMVRESVM